MSIPACALTSDDRGSKGVARPGSAPRLPHALRWAELNPHQVPMGADFVLQCVAAPGGLSGRGVLHVVIEGASERKL